MLSTTYHLYSSIVDFFTKVPSTSNETSNSISEEPPIYIQELQRNINHQICHPNSTTPYRDALLRNVVNEVVGKKTPLYYQRLGYKINNMVENNLNQRKDRYWWIDDYLREVYIDRNRMLKKYDYNIIKRPNKFDIDI